MRRNLLIIVVALTLAAPSYAPPRDRDKVIQETVAELIKALKPGTQSRPETIRKFRTMMLAPNGIIATRALTVHEVSKIEKAIPKMSSLTIKPSEVMLCRAVAKGKSTLSAEEYRSLMEFDGQEFAEEMNSGPYTSAEIDRLLESAGPEDGEEFSDDRIDRIMRKRKQILDAHRCTDFFKDLRKPHEGDKDDLNPFGKE